METFQDPLTLEAVLEAKSIVERFRRKEPCNEDDKGPTFLYIIIKLLELGYNQNVRAVAKRVAEDEKLESLKAYFDVAESLRAASRFKENAIPGQYHLAALYVVVEGFIQLRLTDPKINELRKSPHLRVLKKLRDSVFHYVPRRLSNKLLAFLTQDCMKWAAELRKELKRWLDDNVKQPSPTTDVQMLEAVQKLVPGPEGAEVLSAIRNVMASSGVKLSENDGRREAIETRVAPDFRSILEQVVDGKIEKIWPMLNLFTEAVRKSNTALRPINVDVLAEEYDRRHSPTEA